MSNQQILTPKLLREFGLIMGAAIAGLFGLGIPLLRGHGLPLVPWILAGVFVLLGLIIPKSLGPVYHLWMKIGHVLGWINSRSILGLIFFGLVTPMALVMRIIGRDTMARRFESHQASYRIRMQPRAIKHMEKPY